METKIYKEVAKVAKTVFNNIECAPGTYTAGDIAKAVRIEKEATGVDQYGRTTYKVAKRYFAETFAWKKDFNPLAEYTITIDSFSCTVSGWGVFTMMKRMQTAWKISAKDKAIFVKERPQASAAPVVSFDVPAAAKEVAKAVEKDRVRCLQYVCVDTRRRAVVACNGRVLNAVAVPNMNVAPGAKEHYVITPQLIKSGKGTVNIYDDNTAANGNESCKVDDQKFYDWAKVIPAVCEENALVFDATSFKTFIKSLKSGSKLNYTSYYKTVSFFIESYSKKLTVAARNIDFEQENETAVYLPQASANTFGFCADENVSLIMSRCNKMYYCDSLRPVIFVNESNNSFSLLMPADIRETPAEKYGFYNNKPANEFNIIDALGMNKRPANVETETTAANEPAAAPAAVIANEPTETPTAAPQSTETATTAQQPTTTATTQQDATDGTTAAPVADIVETGNEPTDDAVAAQKSIAREVLAIHRILPGLIMQHKHDDNLFIVILGTTRRGYKVKEIYFYPDSRKRAKVTTRYYFALEINPGGKSLFDICPASKIASVLNAIDDSTKQLAAPAAAADIVETSAAADIANEPTATAANVETDNEPTAAAADIVETSAAADIANEPTAAAAEIYIDSTTAKMIETAAQGYLYTPECEDVDLWTAGDYLKRNYIKIIYGKVYLCDRLIAKINKTFKNDMCVGVSVSYFVEIVPSVVPDNEPTAPAADITNEPTAADNVETDNEPTGTTTPTTAPQSTETPTTAQQPTATVTTQQDATGEPTAAAADIANEPTAANVETANETTGTTTPTTAPQSTPAATMAQQPTATVTTQQDATGEPTAAAPDIVETSDDDNEPTAAALHFIFSLLRVAALVVLLFVLPAANVPTGTTSPAALVADIVETAAPAADIANEPTAANVTTGTTTPTTAPQSTATPTTAQQPTATVTTQQDATDEPTAAAPDIDNEPTAAAADNVETGDNANEPTAAAADNVETSDSDNEPTAAHADNVETDNSGDAPTDGHDLPQGSTPAPGAAQGAAAQLIGVALFIIGF